MRFNVIMPTNRMSEELIPILKSYKKQTYQDFVISIIKEGELQSLKNICENLALHNVKLYCVPQGTGNASVSRNYGLEHACDNEIILFSDDDMMVTPDFIAQHAQVHQNTENAIVRGLRFQKDEDGSFYLTVWEQQALRRWNQQARNDIWAYFVTSNSSVSIRLLKQTKFFDVNFDRSGCEDTDLAYRLLKVGGRPISNEQAVNYHLSIDDMQLKFQERIKNFQYLRSKYPDDPAVKLFVALTLQAIEKKQINNIFLRNAEGI